MAYYLQSNSWVFYFIILVCLVFIGVGLGMLIKLAKNYAKLRQSQHWNTTDGKIIFSDLDAQISTDDEGYQTTTYLAKIYFSYELDGITYESDRINFDYGMRTSNLRKQQSIVEQYPVGTMVPVYYDADDPSQAVLEKRVNGTFTTILVAAVFIIIGVVVGVSSLSVNPPAIIKNLLGN
ncbi:MAG TPA: DUF3592 domain-containing protein [Anaerolineaceae bacterium]|nr:DUF3592 domain-containing protein [Anaerolineaceae bacterium]